ncbi:hypothetical protein LXL04_024684 [Taraxacum kok-saghyz]
MEDEPLSIWCASLQPPSSYPKIPLSPPSENAIFRRRINKWFAIFLRLSCSFLSYLFATDVSTFDDSSKTQLLDLIDEDEDVVRQAHVRFHSLLPLYFVVVVVKDVKVEVGTAVAVMDTRGESI